MKRMMKLFVAALTLFAFSANAQTEWSKDQKKILNWYNSAKNGMDTDKAYDKLLADKKSETVVVAVIDSGVDIEHEDLQGSIWTNTDEIAGNGIDDDKNGYIDDVHGWSFLGNADGENIEHEQLEMTRLLKKWTAKYDGVNEDEVAEGDKAEYKEYLAIKAKVEDKQKSAGRNLENYSMLYKSLQGMEGDVIKEYGKDYGAKDLKKYKKTHEEQGQLIDIWMMVMKQGGSLESLEGGIKHFEGSVKYHYNIDYDARKIVGDDPANFDDKYYGSSDVEGPDAMHGTHCSGIIGATRGNGIGNDGVADNILIMSVRAVPDGDERDKDIALAIRYAVDNGASVVNMSFGKAYSPYQEEVIAAIKYAEEKGVLLVHAAGNDGKDIGEETNFPRPMYDQMTTEFKNWIEVGASTRYSKPADKKGISGLAASFSNYSDKHVDIYAPGLEIVSTVPQSEYLESQGTSMAAPMVTGLAALLKSYFPKLTMFEIRDIIFQSGRDVADIETNLPGDSKVVPFKALCETGKIANVYNAVVMAAEWEAKK